MTKREILLAICEAPGWQPAQPVSSSTERALGELHAEGWILPRIDGWEATPKAIDEYPDFIQADIAKAADALLPPPAEPPVPAPPLIVPLERVECMVRAMVEVMPVIAVMKMLAATPEQLPPRSDGDIGWQFTDQLIERLLLNG